MKDSLPTVQITPELREDLQVLLAAEPVVAGVSNTAGIAQSIRALLALEDGEHPLPEPVSHVLAATWHVDLAGLGLQGRDLVSTLERLLQGDRSAAVTANLESCQGLLDGAVRRSTSVEVAA